MKNTLKIILLILFPIFTFGQGSTSFQKTYGHVGYNYGRCAYQTGDGGYIILGNTSSSSGGGMDIYLIKTDTVGKIKWEKIIGGSEIEWANDFKITKDKGFIIAGYTNINFTNGYDVLLIKTDSMGIVQWTKTYGGADWDMGYSVIEDKDHNYLIAGETSSNSIGDADVYVIKTDSNGDTIWTKHYGGMGSDIGYSIDTTYHSDYLVAGATKKISDSTYDAYLLKIRGNGDTIITKKYGGIYDDVFYCVHQIDDSSYIMCGETQDFGAINYDPWILKTDTFGNIQWNHVSVNSREEGYNDIKRSWKNGLIAIGYTTTWGMGKEDLAATIMDNMGVDIYGRTFGGSENDVGYSVNLTKDSCYIYLGITESFGLGISNIYFLKSDKTGNAPPWSGHETSISENDVNHNSFVSLYPNPTYGLINVNVNQPENGIMKLTVFNTLGLNLFTEKIHTTNTFFSKTIDLSAYPDGIYLIQLFSDKIISTSKVAKQTVR